VRKKEMVNKMESTMVGTKKSPIKLKVKHTAETIKPTKQKASPKRPSMKERRRRLIHFILIIWRGSLSKRLNLVISYSSSQKDLQKLTKSMTQNIISIIIL